VHARPDSRAVPSGGYLWLDCRGHISEPPLVQAVARLQRRTGLHVVGSFPTHQSGADEPAPQPRSQLRLKHRATKQYLALPPHARRAADELMTQIAADPRHCDRAGSRRADDADCGRPPTLPALSEQVALAMAPRSLRLLGAAHLLRPQQPGPRHRPAPGLGGWPMNPTRGANGPITAPEFPARRNCSPEAVQSQRNTMNHRTAGVHRSHYFLTLTAPEGFRIPSTPSATAPGPRRTRRARRSERLRGHSPATSRSNA
jgi:hypothetical protein